MSRPSKSPRGSIALDRTYPTVGFSCDLPSYLAPRQGKKSFHCCCVVTAWNLTFFTSTLWKGTFLCHSVQPCTRQLGRSLLIFASCSAKIANMCGLLLDSRQAADLSHPPRSPTTAPTTGLTDCLHVYHTCQRVRSYTRCTWYVIYSPFKTTSASWHPLQPNMAEDSTFTPLQTATLDID